MKHAFLIGVYKNPTYLKDLISSLLSDNSMIYIHINKNNEDEFKELVEYYSKNQNVFFFSCVKVIWGGISFLDSIRVLIKESLKDSENAYFHLITGQDILIKPLDELFAFFNIHQGENFINYHPMSRQWYNRYYHYHLWDLLNMRNHKLLRGFERVLDKGQSFIRFQRKKLPFNKLYSGLSWWSLDRQAVAYLDEQLNNQGLLSRLKHSFAPDEMVFQNLLLNSPYNFNIVNDNLRYLVFHGASPDELTIDDFDKLQKTNAFFARKIDSVKNADLYHKIKKELNKTEQ